MILVKSAYQKDITLLMLKVQFTIDFVVVKAIQQSKLYLDLHKQKEIENDQRRFKAKVTIQVQTTC